MKYLKGILLTLLSSIFLFSACGADMFDRRLHEPDEFRSPDDLIMSFYPQYECWKSPFNPHEVLRHWPLLLLEYVKRPMLLVMVGNPKIEWNENYKIGEDPSEILIPEGEITAVVVFVFAEMAPQYVELLTYGYADREGNYYIYKWNVDQECYTLYKAGPKALETVDTWVKTNYTNKLYDPTDR